ncbi:hypothetical protein [Schaalia vaccimaxillae]|uniref:hypothetical protein n=1 Tax=Schaalia vaccimaxillae TaxID=183916 RepID=UPI001038FBFF|nr:hypothetical protein [Schaalia vaccimaxillae]
MRTRIAACALSIAMLLGVGITTFPSLIHAPASATQADDLYNFDWIKTRAKAVKFTSEDKNITGKIWVAALATDPLNGARDLLVYGQLDMPYTSQDVGVETFNNHLILNNDTNFIVYNGGYIKGNLYWCEEETVGTYDKTVFCSDGIITVRRAEKSIALTIDNTQIDVPIPEQNATVNVGPLKAAVDEHWAAYQAALTAGMKLEKKSQNNYLAKNQEAESLVAKAESGTDMPSDEEIENMRRNLNAAFAAVAPEPFERGPIQAAIADAEKLLSNNGADGRRLTKETYELVTQRLAAAQNINATADYDTLLVPGHGDPQITHADFVKATNALNSVVADPQYEDYATVDTSHLVKLYDAALTRVPAEGMGFDPASRDRFLDTLERIYEFLNNSVYVNSEDVDARIRELNDAAQGLIEKPLPDQEFNLKVRYQYPAEGAVSNLIHANFTHADGTVVEELLTVKQGEELRFAIDDPLIKRFDGYRPNSFHLNGDDGSLHLVRILTNSKGQQTIAFRATGATAAGAGTTASSRSASAMSPLRAGANRSFKPDLPVRGSLEIRYVAGADPRPATSPDVETDKTSSDSNRGNPDAANQSSTNSADATTKSARQPELARTGASNSVILSAALLFVIGIALKKRHARNS